MALIDEYAGNPDQFPVLRRWNYLNHGGISPLPRVVADAVRQFADAFEQDAYLGELSFGQALKLKQSLGRLIGAEVPEIAIVKNTAEAISTVAFGLDWRPGDRVVTTAVEYPANIYPWMEAAKRFGIELVMVEERGRPDGSRAVDADELLAAAGHPKCRLVAISHVQFASGQRLPLEKIGKWCRDNDRLLCVDAIQSIGAVPFDVGQMNVDFMAAGSQKWMLGPMGAGVLYIRKELTETVRPLCIGAYTVVDPDNYGDYHYEMQPDMRRHECGTPPLPSIAGWLAAVDLMNKIGIDAVSRRIKGLTDRLVGGLKAKGCRIVTPRDAEMWSGIVSWLPADESADLNAIAKRLREQKKIEIVVREKRLRACPHFYNTFEQMDEVVAAV